MAVMYGGEKRSLENVLRDYDIQKERKAGRTIGQLAIKYGLSERQIINIINENG